MSDDTRFMTEVRSRAESEGLDGDLYLVTSDEAVAIKKAFRKIEYLLK